MVNREFIILCVRAFIKFVFSSLGVWLVGILPSRETMGSILVLSAFSGVAMQAYSKVAVSPATAATMDSWRPGRWPPLFPALSFSCPPAPRFFSLPLFWRLLELLSSLHFLKTSIKTIE